MNRSRNGTTEAVDLYQPHSRRRADSALPEKFLDEAFIGSFRIFVSSDGASIRAGDNWSSSIEQALTETELVLAVITERARERRWIYFECGGAYFARKRVVPICCRNLGIDALSPPLSWLQAIDGSDPDSVSLLIDAVAHTFDLRKPKCEVAQLARFLSGLPCDGPGERFLEPPAGVHQRAFPLFLLIDTSASMSGERIERLSASIGELLDDLLQTPSANFSILISIIAFGTEAREIVPLSPLRAETLQFTLEPSGATSLGAALHLLASRLANASQMPRQHLRPMILVFTDGEPTDDWRPGLDALNQTALGKTARRVCVALGDTRDLSVLKAIAGESIISVPDVSNIQGLSSFFTWMSSSVRAASKSNDPEDESDLPPLPDGNFPVR